MRNVALAACMPNTPQQPVYTALNACVRRFLPNAQVAQALKEQSVRLLPDDMLFLISRDTHEVVRPALEFVAHQYLIRLPRNHDHRLRRSRETRKATAYDLKDFYDFLDAERIALADVDEPYMNAYVRSMIDSPCPGTGRPYAAATITRRYASVASFVGWAMDQGIVRHRFQLPRPEVAPYGRWCQMALDRAPRGRTIAEQAGLPRREDKSTHVKVMGFDEMRLIFDGFGPSPLVETEDGRNGLELRATTRNRLMCECGLMTGMRRAEICNLPLSTVRNAHLSQPDFSPTSVTEIQIVGKGPKTRKIYIPEWLIRAILQYADNERRLIVERARSENKSYVEPDAVFLNTPSARIACGAQVSPKTFNRFFRRTQLATIQRLERDCSLLIPHLFVVHDLRHTYAVWTYVLSKRAGVSKPITFVQAQLGHSQMSTTSDLYLAPASAFEIGLHDTFAFNFVAELSRYAEA